MPYSVDPFEVTLTLRAEDDEIGTRTIVLSRGNSTLDIGRGSQTEVQLRPQYKNAWFGSRVMSRAHARIDVNPDTRAVTLTDIGSMHGTYIDGRRLLPYKETDLGQGRLVTFGANILRGDLTYQALQLKISYQWSDEYAIRMQQWQEGLEAPIVIPDDERPGPRASAHLVTKNSYSLDYSDDEPTSDHEAAVVHEPVVQPEHGYTLNACALIDAAFNASSDSEQHPEDSTPTSPADDHSTDEIEITSSQKVVREVIVIEDQEDAKEVEKVPPVSEQVLQSEPSSHRADEDGEMYDHPSECDSSSNDDEGYAELDDFSEMESQVEAGAEAEAEAEAEAKPEWRPACAEPINNMKACKFELRFPPEKRAGSPSDAAMPKMNYSNVDPANERPARALPEIHHPLSSSIVNLPFYNTDYSPYSLAALCEANKLPALQSAPWWDQGAETADAAPLSPAYKFAPASFYQQGSSFSPKPAKVSIHDILDKDTPTLTTGTKRKWTSGDARSDVSSFQIVATPSAPGVRDHIPQISDSSSCRALTSAPTKTIEPGLVESASQSPPVPTSQVVEPLQQLISEASTIVEPTGVPEDHKAQATFHEMAELERPRKRAKTQKATEPRGSRGKTFFKYAATALAGAAIGSVGTIFGLAALPADYFL